jgi:hypothetical protein
MVAARIWVTPALSRRCHAGWKMQSLEAGPLHGGRDDLERFF